jgi:hypothetical protein
MRVYNSQINYSIRTLFHHCHIDLRNGTIESFSTMIQRHLWAQVKQRLMKIKQI